MQFMMGPHPRCYIPSFMQIGPVEKKVFEGFLPYMAMAAILVMWTPYVNFRSPIPWRLHMKFDFNLPSGSRGEDI